MNLQSEILAIEKELEDDKMIRILKDAQDFDATQYKLVAKYTKEYYRQAILSLIPKIAEALTPEEKLFTGLHEDKDYVAFARDASWNNCRIEINRRKNLLMKNE